MAAIDNTREYLYEVRSEEDGIGIDSIPASPSKTRHLPKSSCIPIPAVPFRGFERPCFYSTIKEHSRSLLLLTAVIIIIAVSAGLGASGNSTNSKDSVDDALEGAHTSVKVAGYDYSQCPRLWAQELSVPEGEDVERECSTYSGNKLVCELTVNCCWEESSRSCITYEGQIDCNLLTTKSDCVKNTYCVWREQDSICRRGFPVTMAGEQDKCKSQWEPLPVVVSNREQIQPCYSFSSSQQKCAKQAGCCWRSDLGDCRPYGDEPECESQKTIARCANTFPESSCTWDGTRCRRGPVPITRFPTMSKTPGPQRPEVKTSFVILVADDLGYGDTGFNGGIARTPSLDSLANDPATVQLGNMHGATMCSPSRAMLLSGQYPDRNCVIGTRADAQNAARDEMTTLGHDARLGGYRTAFLGKYHLGLLTNNTLGKRGFDSWTASFGNIFAFDAPCHCDEVRCQGLTGAACANAGECYLFSRSVCSARATSSCWFGHMARNTFVQSIPHRFECGLSTLADNRKDVVSSQMPRQVMVADYLATEFAKFLESVPSAVPFLTVVGFTEVHIPFVADPKARAETESALKIASNSPRANYVSAIEALDRGVGNIRRVLEEHNREKNTVVFFFSDNGPENSDRGGAGSTGPLRGFKRQLFEGGHRVPALMHWPGRITENVKIMELTSVLDIRATVQDIIRSESPNVYFDFNSELDGVSLVDLALDPHSWYRRDPLVVCSSVTGAESTWKPCETYAYYEGSHKIIVERGDELNTRKGFMFDLYNDLGESHNIISSSSQQFSSMATRGMSMVREIMKTYSTNCQRR